MKSIVPLSCLCFLACYCSNAKFAYYERSYKASFMCQCIGNYYPDTITIPSGNLCLEDVRTLIEDTNYKPNYYKLIDSINQIMILEIKNSCDYDFPLYPELFCVSGYCLDAYQSKTLSRQARIFAKRCKQRNKDH